MFPMFKSYRPLFPIGVGGPKLQAREAAEGTWARLLVDRSSAEKQVGVYIGSAGERGAKEAR